MAGILGYGGIGRLRTQIEKNGSVSSFAEKEGFRLECPIFAVLFAFEMSGLESTSQRSRDSC
jgi:hypothetical protein